jgi:hypothetical protein
MKRLLVVLLLALVACAPAARPSGETSSGQTATIPDPAALERVSAERLEIPGFPERHTPEALNRAVYVRYSLPKPVKARAVIVLMPGFLGGAANFDRLARSIVSSDPSLEVWAVDRRSNLLEDHRVLEAAFNARDPLSAWRYHVRDAGKPGGFKPLEGKDAPFVGYWGLRVHLEDWRRVVQLARGFGERIILGGHSLGAVMVSLYAAWDFDGTPGYRDVDGLLLLDGVAGRTNGDGSDVTQRDYLEGTPGPFGIRGAGKTALEAGTASPFFAAFGFDALGLSKLGAAAMLARFDPNGDSPGGIVPYRASNLAAALVAGDDRYALVNAFSVSSGYATNAQVAINALGFFLGNFNVLEVTGVAPGSSRVEWFTPAPNDENELTDPLDFASRFYAPRRDYQEWYFPARLSLDIGVVGLEAPVWAREELRVYHMAAVKLPTLALIGGRGIVTDRDAFKPLERKTGQAITVKRFERATHLDVLAARANPIKGWIAEFARGQ